eukprot:SAG11_NODE_7398_length_1149_cov_286.303810_1_plen_125_part_00
MSKILKIEASYIDGSNFIVPCDCSRKFHKFGNCKDKISNRTEYRGMCGHLCDKYTDCEANITVNTLRVDQIPKSRVLKKLAAADFENIDKIKGISGIFVKFYSHFFLLTCKDIFNVIHVVEYFI